MRLGPRNQTGGLHSVSCPPLQIPWVPSQSWSRGPEVDCPNSLTPLSADCTNSRHRSPLCSRGSEVDSPNSGHSLQTPPTAVTDLLLPAALSALTPCFWSVHIPLCQLPIPTGTLYLGTSWPQWPRNQGGNLLSFLGSIANICLIPSL